MNNSQDKFVNLIRKVLAANGIDVKGKLKFSRRFPGEGFATIQVQSLDNFIRLLGDGKYYIEAENVNVRSIDEHPFSIVYLFIDSEYKVGKWNIRIFPDKEDTYTSDIAHLERRRQKIIRAIKSSLELLTLVTTIYRER